MTPSHGKPHQEDISHRPGNGSRRGNGAVEQAYIYGSWAARYLGEPGTVPHDVDVLAVGTVSGDDLYDSARKAELRLGREGNICGVSPQYWDAPDRADSFMRHIRERPLVKLELSP